MENYITPLDSETDPDAPLTSQLAKRWDGNPIAIAEGAADAPRVQGQALGNVVLAHGDMGATFLTATANIDRAKDIYAILNAAGGGAATYLQVRMSDDNGATWSAVSNTVGPIAMSGMAQLTIDVETGDFTASAWNGSGVELNSGTAVLPTGAVNAIGVRINVGDAVGTIMCLGGVS